MNQVYSLCGERVCYYRNVNAPQAIDQYIASLPDWQRVICTQARALIHQAAPQIIEEIKFTNRPYFTYKGNVCAFLPAKSHVNIFVYDPIVPDPQGIINQGHANQTAQSIQVLPGNFPDEQAFIALIRAVVAHNERGGWRKLQRPKA